MDPNVEPIENKTASSDFALDHILNYERKFDEFGTPLLKRKSLEPDSEEQKMADVATPSPALSGNHLQATTTFHSLSNSKMTSSSSSRTTTTTTTHGNVMRSPLSTFKLMSQTIAEYGDMIAQRRTEIAELQRANQLRLTNSAYPKVTPAPLVKINNLFHKEI